MMMNGYLAIVAYRSVVGGLSSESLDFQVRWYSATDPDEVRRLIQDEPLHCYKNSDGDDVCWELVEVFAIEPLSQPKSGDEVIGFIASLDELNDLV